MTKDSSRSFITNLIIDYVCKRDVISKSIQLIAGRTGREYKDLLALYKEMMEQALYIVFRPDV